MRSQLGRLTLAALVATALWGPATAQEITPLAPPDMSRYLRWGPFRVRPGIQIPALGYDSNVFYRSTGNEVGDYFVAIAPTINGVVLFGHRAFLTFDERLEFYAYATEHALNYFNQFGQARVTVPFRRWGVYADLGYNRTRDRPIDAQDIRPIRIDAPFGAGAIVKFGWRTDAEFGFTRGRYTAYDPDEKCDPSVTPGCLTIAQLNDRTETGLRVLARYLAFGRTRIVLTAVDHRISFDEEAVERNGRERRILPGLDFGIGGRVFGNFHVGYARFDLSRAGATDFSGVVGDAAVGYRLGGLGSYLSLQGGRDVRYSVLESADLFTYSNGTLTLVKYFNRFLGMEAGAGHGTLRFLGDSSGRVDVLDQGTLGIRLRLSENDIGRRVEYAFRYVLTRRNSTIDSLDQTRGTIGFGLSYGY
jgi:hypothetical protein